jgi:CRP-like cAMP-binding protein
MRMALTADPRQNRLLAALPDEEWTRWLAHLEAVDLPLGKVLCESGSTLSHVYFPTTSIVSLLYVMEDGASAEIAGVGHEGIVGIPMFMGGGGTPGSAVVTSGGHGHRLERRSLMREFDRDGSLRSALLRYTQAQSRSCLRQRRVIATIRRAAAQPMAAGAADRVQPGELVMTQELLAGLLGVRRESITQRRASCRRWAASATGAGTSRFSTTADCRPAPASAMPWSRRSRTGCSRWRRFSRAARHFD